MGAVEGFVEGCALGVYEGDQLGCDVAGLSVGDVEGEVLVGTLVAPVEPKQLKRTDAELSVVWETQ